MVPGRIVLVLVLAAVTCGLSLYLPLGAQETSTPPTAPKETTFNRDVAPIFFKNCVVCHRENDIAPMSLMTYKDARPWARAIREMVTTRQMPPWSADPHYGEFANNA